MVEEAAEEWRRGPGLLASMGRSWILVWAFVATAVLVAYGWSLLQTPTYTASATMFLEDPASADVLGSSSRSGAMDPATYALREAQRVTSPEVATRAAESLEGRFTPGDIQRTVQAQTVGELGLLTVTGSDTTAEGAADKANAVVEAYQAVRVEQVTSRVQTAIEQLQAAMTDVRERIAQAPAGEPGREANVAFLVELNTRAQELAINTAAFSAGTGYVEPAQVPDSPSEPSPVRNAAVAGVLALTLAAAFVLWRGSSAGEATERPHRPEQQTRSQGRPAAHSNSSAVDAARS